MSELTPCPQCHSERVWARAALGAYGITHVAFCPGCGRAATICTRCGSELVVTRQSSWVSPGRPRVESVLQCPACRQTVGSQPVQPAASAPGFRSSVTSWSPTAAGPATVHRSSASRFIAAAAAPPVMQRVADDCERLAAGRYTRQRLLMGIVDEAARRADAMARLEIELSRLDTLADPDTPAAA